MANYYLDSEGKLTTKNDKKKKKSTNYYLDSNGRLVPMEDDLEEDSGIKLFKAGAFEDGWQPFDLVKSVGSTVVDLGAGAVKGILGLGEGIVDAGMHYGVAGVADLVGADSFADDVRRVANKNTVDNWFAPLKETAIERNSLLGRTGDSVAEAVGQIGGIILTGGVGAAAGLSGAGVTALTAGTMFASSAGAGVSEAYNSGASDKEAYTYGAMKGAIDAGSELIFGGLGKTVNALGLSRGISSLDDVFAKKLSEKISNRVLKNAVQYGVKASGEGLEEVIASHASAVAKWMTYMSDEELSKIVEDENALEQFVVGALASGISQSADVTRSIKNNTDFITGMTANEETVVNKEAEKRIKEREDAGEKLTNKQKNDIHKQVESDLAKGYIDIETIESTLGGETYSRYKSLTDQESALKKEIESLENLPKEQITVKQSERLAEARQQLEALDTATVRERLGQEVSELAKSDRLSESYNERARRGQSFEADLTKYSEKERAVVQKAVESGILNNTNKTHDFVDMIAKLSAEKGVSFNFTDNQRLRESGFAVEGATVNGFVDGTDITLNIDSAKALNTVVGHEITHVLEGTELYGELQKAIKEYAEMKGEYKTRLEAISKVYNGRNADIEAEITADLVGDYLFTDSDFISKLSAEKPNIFKRIYEEIKYLVKLATAGSAEARQLEKVKRAFDKAYREGGKTSSDTTKYSLYLSEQDVPDYLKSGGRNNKSRQRRYDEGQQIIISTDAEFEEFVKKSIEGNPDNMVAYGKVESQLAEQVKDKSDSEIDITDAYLELLSDDVQHAYKEHMTAKEAGDLDMSVADLLFALKKVNQAEVVSARRYKDGGQRVTLAVAVDDGMVMLVELASKSAGSLRLKTGWKVTNDKFEQKYKSSLPSTGNRGSTNTVRDNTASDTIIPQMSENASGKNIRDVSTGYAYGETYFNMTYTQDGKVVGTLEYGVYEGEPNVKMIEVAPEYRRQGIGTKLLQELQNKYPDAEINFGMTTPDGTKLLESVTYDVTDEAVVADKQKLKELQTELNELQDRLDVLYDTENLSEEQSAELEQLGDRWEEVYDAIRELNESLRGKKATKTFVKTDGVKYSISDSEGHQLTKEQQEYFKYAKTRDEQGKLKPYYHGTGRADRVGNVFLPERATSGPMAFFTDSKAIADNYARDKQDTSLAYDEMYRDYYTQFRVVVDGQNLSVSEAWDKLPTSKRVEIRNKAAHVTFDEDMENIIYDETADRGTGGFDRYRINEHKGNYLSALTGEWLEDGNLFGQEEEFLKVLSLVGLDNVQYMNPDVRNEKTYQVYLNVTNPFVTTDISPEMLQAFKDAAAEAEITVGNGADMWDKRNFNPEAWIKKLESDIKNGTTYSWTSIPDFVTDTLKAHGYDGIFDEGGKGGGSGHQVVIPFYSEQIKNIDNDSPTTDPDIRKSLSANGEQPVQYGTYNVYGQDIALKQDIAPVAEAVQEPAETVQDDVAPVVSDAEAVESENWRDAVWNIREPELEDGSWTEEYIDYYNSVRRKAQMSALREALADFDSGMTPAELRQKAKEALQEYESAKPANGEAHTPSQEIMLASLYGQYTFYDSAAKNPSWAEEMRAQLEFAPMTEDQANERDTRQTEQLYSLDENSDMPNEVDAPLTEDSPAPENPFDKRDIKEVGRKSVKAYMYENPEVKPFFQEEARNMLGELQSSIKGEKTFNGDLHYESGGAEGWFGTKRMTSPEIAYLLDNFKYTYAQIEKGLRDIIEDHGAENNAVSKRIEFLLDERLREGYTHFMYGDAIPPNQDYINLLTEKQITEYNDEAFNAWASTLTDSDVPATEDIAPVREAKAPAQAKAEAAPLYEAQPKKGVVEGQLSMVEEPEAPKTITRSELHSGIIDKIKTFFADRGFDFDQVLKKAKNLSTFRTVDNTPQRVMEKALGYKEGQVLSDLTVNQVAQNETEGIKWLSSFTDRKRGLLAQISKQYGIKPGSKESAAAQMYAEGFYVAENNDIIAYGDAELAKDFPNRRVQESIKALARDGRIRQIYDETLRMINESRARNAYPEIPRLDNYFLHFRAMDDTFSRLGLPFNPNDIRAKDLPTDLNGVTADLKPGQPYFASAMHRTGKRTSFDLLGGLERYLTAAKNQIYHIDDIQTLRALRNYIADTYGQAKGLEGIDTLSEEEAQERISQVYGSHLSTFAKFLNEEANVLAGKTSLIDRGLEGIIGRRGMTFLDTVNRQVGANMVGFNVSSSLTNFIAVAQAVAKSNKAAFLKAFAQTTSNKLGSIVGRSDGFAEQSPVMIRRKGSDRFYRTPWQKAGDAGYFLMGAVDNISTELIARTKYNELVSKGMDAQKAHYETDKWVSRLMGDRSLGQQPQLYNSKMLGLLTKFQLEVRNQLDSQFYDTIQEAKVSNEEIENGLARNARTAAKVTSTFFQLAVAQHLFGKAFESIAGYNPAFDILGALIKAFGFDDDEESEDTVLDNVEQGFMELLEDMPYASTFTGGRIPIESALPIKQLFTGKDDYGNEKSRLETLAEAAPYYLLPSGFGQIKKTYQGSQMFDDDLPIAGSYTDSGNLRFSVEDTAENRLQAGLFGQWASDEARDYFDSERSPLKEKQIQELVDLDLPIREYWDYRKGLSEQETLEDKFEYINSQPVSTERKNIMINNVVDRKEPVDMSSYDDFADYEEFDFYTKNTEKYNFLQENGVSYSEYKSSEEAKEEYDNAYSWVKNNPNKVTVAKAVTSNVIEYRRYASALNDIRADKDASGKTINGSAKEKKIAYIDSLNIDYGAKLILFKSEYKSDDTYNYELLEYLNSRDDISWSETVTILTELGFTVRRDGTVEW